MKVPEIIEKILVSSRFKVFEKSHKIDYYTPLKTII